MNPGICSAGLDLCSSFERLSSKIHIDVTAITWNCTRCIAGVRGGCDTPIATKSAKKSAFWHKIKNMFFFNLFLKFCKGFRSKRQPPFRTKRSTLWGPAHPFKKSWQRACTVHPPIHQLWTLCNLTDRETMDPHTHTPTHPPSTSTPIFHNPTIDFHVKLWQLFVNVKSLFGRCKQLVCLLKIK